MPFFWNDTDMPAEATEPQDEKQCRICLDGVAAESELGRLIRPCLCKGSISHVHIKCLQTWRNTSASHSAFFACPQCHYQYRFARTKIAGIATNPVIVGGISGLLFTVIVMVASFLTTFSMSLFEEPTTSYFYSGWFYVSPIGLVQDLITAALRILKEQDTIGLFDEAPGRARRPLNVVPPLAEPKPRGLIMSLVRRFILGLPMVGAGSLVYMLLSVPFLGPLQWLARQRGSRRRRDQSRDIAAVLIVALVVIGAAKALYHVYRLTETYTKRLLLRAEDAILEVN